MNSIIKKTVVFSLIGLMQVGFGTPAIEAASLYNERQHQIIQLDNRHYYDNDKQREHDERLHRENERHEREMRRRHHESEREWRERQRHERERHDRALRDIAAILIGIVIGRASDN